MVNIHQYISALTYKKSREINEIAKNNDCVIRFSSSKDIINAINMSSLLNMDSDFYQITVNGNNENEVLKSIIKVIK